MKSKRSWERRAQHRRSRLRGEARTGCICVLGGLQGSLRAVAWPAWWQAEGGGYREAGTEWAGRWLMAT